MTKINIHSIEQVAYDELAGTGLEFAVVVWRPGFMERGDQVAVGMRCRKPVEAIDALMKAADYVNAEVKADAKG